jgi:hypothetical protein
MERVSKHGHEHRARCPSFETRPAAAPQDEVVRIDLKRKDYSSQVRAGVRRQMLIVSD